jgi:hypothetical protein
MQTDKTDWPEQRRPHAIGHTHATTESNHRCCPQCGSAHVEQRNRGVRVGGTIGTIAGTVGGACRAMAGYEVGFAVGAAAFGPPGAIVGAVSGAIISALLGGTTGWTIGTKLGEAVDKSILDNHRCLACQHTFSHPAAQ